MGRGDIAINTILELRLGKGCMLQKNFRFSVTCKKYKSKHIPSPDY